MSSTVFVAIAQFGHDPNEDSLEAYAWGRHPTRPYPNHVECINVSAGLR